MHIRIVAFLFVNPPLVPPLLYSIPLTQPVPLFYLLGDPFSFARGVNTYPLLSLVG
jgi:hypothetical protein